MLLKIRVKGERTTEVSSGKISAWRSSPAQQPTGREGTWSEKKRPGEGVSLAKSKERLNSWMKMASELEQAVQNTKHFPLEKSSLQKGKRDLLADTSVERSVSSLRQENALGRRENIELLSSGHKYGGYINHRKSSAFDEPDVFDGSAPTHRGLNITGFNSSPASGGDMLNAERLIQHQESQINVLKEKLKHAQTQRDSNRHEVDGMKAKITNLEHDNWQIARDLEESKNEARRASQRLKEYQEEFEQLQSSLDRDSQKIRKLKETVDESNARLSEAEQRVIVSAGNLQTEKSRRLELEQRILKSNEEISNLETQLKCATNMFEAEKSRFHLEFDTLQEEITRSHQEVRQEQTRAEKLESLLEKSSNARKDSEIYRSSLQRSLDEAHAQIEAVTYRAERAEELAAEATAENRRLKSRYDNGLDKETEICALREVLNTVTATAQAKDIELQRVASAFSQLKEEWSSERLCHQNELTALQYKKTELSKMYENKLKTLQNRVRELQTFYDTSKPVSLEIVVQDSGWHPGQVTPDAMRRREAARIRDAVNRATDKINQEIHLERKEHMEALRELETSHAAQLGRIVEEIEDRSSQSEQEARHKLCLAEEELLSSQEKIAQLNAIVDKLKAKCSKYKEEAYGSSRRALVAEKESEEIKQQMNKAKTELAEAQDEVEALLTARVEALSRANSVCDPEEWLTGDFENQQTSGGDNSGLASSPMKSQRMAHKAPKPKSPIKRIASYMKKMSKSPSKKVPRPQNGHIVAYQ
eukprot:jgi/Picsp_1/827/NSC_04315-R2_u-box domain-containing protein